jgi:hypothetical protein
MPELNEPDLDDTDHIKPVDRLTRKQMVNSLMEYSPYGILGEVFVLEAIRYYSEMVSNTEPKEGGSEVISPKLWHGIALNVKERLVANFDGA